MTKRRGGIHGSNHLEICPLCERELTTRFAAVSHYRAHVRRGELDGRPSTEPARVFKFPDSPDEPRRWWDRGLGRHAAIWHWAKKHNEWGWLAKTTIGKPKQQEDQS